MPPTRVVECGRLDLWEEVCAATRNFAVDLSLRCSDLTRIVRALQAVTRRCSLQIETGVHAREQIFFDQFMRHPTRVNPNPNPYTLGLSQLDIFDIESFYFSIVRAKMVVLLSRLAEIEELGTIAVSFAPRVTICFAIYSAPA
jgi:hypothetical protein